MKRIFALVCVCSLLAAASGLAIAGPKNIILMVSDGWGYNQIDATNYWHGVSSQAYQNFSFKSAMSTYSANNANGYNPSQAWNYDANTGAYTPNQAYLKTGATDSASAMTAMMTGVKNYDGQINISTSGQPLKTAAQYAKELGKATGAVTSVEWTHATPAAVSAHVDNRNYYSTIATEMIYQSGLDVIMGAGHPLYNDNHSSQAANYTYVGQDNWNALVNGTTDYRFIETEADFLALANGTLDMNGKNKVLGNAQAGTTLQEKRSGDKNADPFSIALNSGVPTLATMTMGAINVLGADQDGFFLMVEGGAVDWANHDNGKGRLIEEQTDFNNAVDSVISWIAGNGGWEQNLLIVTGDHECGLLLGPNGETGVVDNNAGVMPGMKYFSGSHTNSLIPIFAQGAGSEMFAQYVTGLDPVHGGYIDNTDIFKVMYANTVPEPGSIIALVTGLAGLAGAVVRRRK